MERPPLPRNVAGCARFLAVAGLRAPCPPWLAASPVLLKVARFGQQEACLEVEGQHSVAEAAALLLDAPRNFEEFQLFLRAADYMLVDVPLTLLRAYAEELLELRSAARAFELARFGVDSVPCRRVLLLAMAGNPGELRRHFHRMGYDTGEASELLAQSSSSPLPPAAEDDDDALPAVARELLRCARASRPGGGRAPAIAASLLGVVDACLFRAGDTVEGASEALLNMDALAGIWPVPRMAQLCRRYLRRLYEHDRVAGPHLHLRHCHALGRLLSLGLRPTDVVPSSATASWSCWLLPCNAADPLPLVVASEAVLRRRVADAVPWLDAAWCRGLGAGLTGSLLTELAVDAGSPLAPADDVDLWVETPAALEEAMELVHRCMREWAFGLVPPGVAAPVVEVCAMGGHRWRLEVKLPDRHLESAAARCDLYVNSYRRVANYHLPQVRASFDGARLLVCASCALSWASALNIDYSYFASASKTPLEIIARKWAAGFNVLLNRQEHDMVVDYLRHHRRSWLEARLPHVRGDGDALLFLMGSRVTVPALPRA
jgi:hypothetical protein